MTKRKTTRRHKARIGRPPLADVRQAIAIRIHPNVLAAYRTEAAQRGIGYQTLMQEVLAQHLDEPGRRPEPGFTMTVTEALRSTDAALDALSRANRAAIELLDGMETRTP